MKKNESLLVKFISFAFFVIMLIINYTYQAEVSAISQVNKPLIQPSGYTFSIWVLIYLGLFCMFIYSFLKKEPSIYEHEAIKYLLPLNFTFNSLWVLSYTSEQFLVSCFIIVGVLLTTANIYLIFKQQPTLPKFIPAVFSIYLGWISVATIVNIFSFVNRLNPVPWTMDQQLILTILVLIIVVLFAIYMLVRYNDKLIPLTIVWSLVGIAMRQTSPFLTLFCYSASALLILLVLVFWARGRRKQV